MNPKIQTKQSISLIGMPGAGKTFLAGKLSKALGIPAFDTDEFLSSLAGRSIRNLALDREKFLFLEKMVVLGCLPLSSPKIISTGGSVIYSEEAMAFLKEKTVIIHVVAELETLERRLGKNLRKRGVIFRPGQTLKSLMEERMPLYRKWADLEVQSNET